MTPARDRTRGPFSGASRLAHRWFRAVARWPAVIAWMALIFGLSSIPNEVVRPSGGVPLDKVAHFLMYGVLGALLAGAIARRGAGWRAAVLVALAAGAIYGATDEFHQRFVPGRDPALDDWLADCAGTLAGAAVAWVVAASPVRPARKRVGNAPRA